MSLLWRLYLPQAALVLACSVAIATLVSHSVSRSHIEWTQDDLGARARLAARSERIDWQAEPGDLDPLASEVSSAAGARVTLVRADGVVLGDSQAAATEMENHGQRPEILEAMSGETGYDVRTSATVLQPMMYVAVPATSGARPVGVVRLAQSLTRERAALTSIRRRIVGVTLVVVGLGALLALVSSRLVSQPIARLAEGAERFAAGDLTEPIPVPETPELAHLARVLNRMGRQLDERLSAMAAGSAEREGILRSMAEGVVAVDEEQRVISMNSAAVELLGVSAAPATGRVLQDVVRNPDLERVVSGVLATGEVDSLELGVSRPVPRILGAHCTLLPLASGARGAVIVLSDLTRIRRLEEVRREFVANVSHELRTPLTAVKGFLEALRDGAALDQATAERFLAGASRQADRLQAIIEDLLLLSRLEEQGASQRLPVESTSLLDVLRSAVETCEPQARSGEQTMSMACSPELTCPMNAPLVEQAVVNLVTNALKHSARGGSVELRAVLSGDGVEVEVEDHGTGIDASHLPRLFERFYRVDRARSRSEGGTGLGLAIVKHVAQAHGGTVDVESRLGVGSRFRIRLPLDRSASGLDET